METAPKSMRGFLSGFVQSGYTFGFLIASIVFQIMLSAYPGNSFVSEGGWRIMFYTGIIPGLIAIFVGFKMNESKLWLKRLEQKNTDGSLRKGKGSPLREIVGGKEARKRFLLALIVMTGLMYAYYTTMGFMPTFLQKYLNIEKHEAATIMIAATISSFNRNDICWFYQSIYWKDDNIDFICLGCYNTCNTYIKWTSRLDHTYSKNVLYSITSICCFNSIWSNACLPIRKISNNDKK